MVKRTDNKLLISKLSVQIKKQQAKIKALQKENALQRTIIELIPGNVFWKDVNGYFLGCNLNVAKLCGLSSPKEIVGKHNRDFFAPEITAHAEAADREVITSATEKYLEETGPSLNYPKATYLSKKTPLCDSDGKLIGLLGVSFDITERKKMEEDLKVAKEKAEASNRAKTQFLAVVNHELRTPLASIAGLMEFLKEGNISTQEEKNILAAIDNCTQHLLNLVNDVLDFSRLETGKYNIRSETINLNTLLSEVYAITQALAQKKGLSLTIEGAHDVPKYIISDGGVLRQILINLVSNAIKFTEIGAVRIKLSNLGIVAQKIALDISVIDTGSGIPSEQLSLIFEPFQQLEDAYTRQSSRSGTGLGLAIVDKLASLIGARVEVISNQGQGSTFSLRGKFKLATVEQESLADLKFITPNGPLKKQKIKKIEKPQPLIAPGLQKTVQVLLIEDDPIVQFVHKKMLTDLGCEVEAFTHGQEAIAGLRNHDIILVDISLPDISGFEVIKAIRQKTTCTPVIALTVYTGKEEKSACLAAGANEFSSKPISPASLRKLLGKYLNT